MINYEQVFGEVHISFYSEQGDIRLMKVPVKHSDKFQWMECDENDPHRHKNYVSHEGIPVKKVSTRGLNKYRMIEFLNAFPEAIKKKIHAPNQPRKFFMDIETEILEGFPDVNNPKERLLTNAFCDQKGQCMLTGLIPLGPNQIKRINDRVNSYFAELPDVKLRKKYTVKYKSYDTENLMMLELFHRFIPQMPMIAGWNFIKFDWAFLVNRARRLGVSPEKSSPSGNMFELHLRDKFNPANKQIVEIPYHRAIVDYLTIFGKWDTSMKFKTSLNLDYVANEVLGVKKVSYSGTLMDLYNNDYESYLYYNIVDTILVSLIDEKLQTFNTMMALASEGGVQLHDSAFASVIIESLFSKSFGEQNKVFVKKDYDRDNSSYDGGFVYEPKKGIFQDVVIFDYESEFPSIMMFGNTGVDTLIGKTTDEGKTYMGTDGKMHNIDPNKHIWLASGAVYLKSDDEGNEVSSVMRTVVSQLFDQRIFAKHAPAQIDREIKELEKMLDG